MFEKKGNPLIDEEKWYKFLQFFQILKEKKIWKLKWGFKKKISQAGTPYSPANA